MTKGDKELWVVFGSAGALLIAYLLWPKPVIAKTVTPPAAPPAPAPVAPTLNGAIITLVPNQTGPGQGVTTEGIAIGDSITIQLPAGGLWTSQNGAPAFGNAPISWVYQGPGTVDYTWTDSTGAAQHTNMTFYTVVG
jgi:hypothetical protein